MSRSVAQALEVRLRGVPRVLAAGAVVVALKEIDAALLLVLAAEGPTPRARIQRLLWPHVEVGVAQNRLRQRLHKLHQGAGAKLVEGTDVLDLARGVTHDWAASAADDEPDAVLWELVQGVGGDDMHALLRAIQVRWSIARLASLDAARARLLDEDRVADAISNAEQVLRIDPAREPAYRDLIQLHLRQGDVRAARAAFERCVRSLRETQDADVDESTRALADTFLSAPEPRVAVQDMPSSLAHPAVSIARERALDRVCTAVAHERLVVVTGPAGIGKSRLLADVARTLGSRCVRAWGWPLDESLSLTTLTRVLEAWQQRCRLPSTGWVRKELARLLPDLGPAPRDAAEPHRVRRAVAESLAVGRTHGIDVLLVDDVHHADHDSLRILLSTLDDPRGPAQVWTVRSNEVPTPLRSYLSTSPAGGLATVTLLPLTLPQVQTWLRSLGLATIDPQTWARPLVALTGGHPLAMLEVLRDRWSVDRLATLPQPLVAPPDLRTAVAMRLERLEAPALELCRFMAVAAGDATFDLAQALLDLDTAALGRMIKTLEQACIAADLRLSHDLVREAALSTMTRQTRMSWHGRIARALAAQDAAPVRVAWHAREGRDTRTLSRAAQEAARALEERGRLADAHRLWLAAWRACRQQGDDEASFQALAQALRIALEARSDARVPRLLRVIQALAKDEGQRAEVAAKRAEWHLLTTDYPRALDAAEAAMRHAHRATTSMGERTPDGPRDDDTSARRGDRGVTRAGPVRDDLMRDARLMLAAAQAGVGRAQDALDLLDELASRGEIPVRGGDALMYWQTRGVALVHAGRPHDSLTVWETAVDLGESTGRLEVAAVCLSNMAHALLATGRVRRAWEVSSRAVDLRARHAEAAGLSLGVGRMNHAVFCGHAGRFTEAVDELTRLVEAWSAGGQPGLAAVAANSLATFLLRAGQIERARHAVSSAPCPDTGLGLTRRCIVEARLADVHDDLAYARAVAALEARLHAAAADTADNRLALMFEVAAHRDPRDASALLARAADGARSAQRLGALQGIELRQAEIARALRSDDVAASLAHAIGLRVERDDVWAVDLTFAEFAWRLSNLLDASGDTAAAASLRRQGIAWLDEAMELLPVEQRRALVTQPAAHRALREYAAGLNVIGDPRRDRHERAPHAHDDDGDDPHG